MCNETFTNFNCGDVGGSKNFNQFVEQKVQEAKAFHIDENVARRLASKYGSNVDQLFNIAQTAQLHDIDLPLEIYVELIYSVQNEMVYINQPTSWYAEQVNCILIFKMF